LQLNDNEFENEVNNLIEWCEDLDYEKYIGNWHHLATSAYVGAPNQDPNMLGSSLNNGKYCSNFRNPMFRLIYDDKQWWKLG
jgi:hypothetical protein